MLGPMKKIEAHVSRYRLDEMGNIIDVIPVHKSYVIRRPKGSSEHAAIRRFMRRAPRYQHIGNLLVMGKRRARGDKSGTICPVVEFP